MASSQSIRAGRAFVELFADEGGGFFQRKVQMGEAGLAIELPVFAPPLADRFANREAKIAKERQIAKGRLLRDARVLCDFAQGGPQPAGGQRPQQVPLSK